MELSNGIKDLYRRLVAIERVVLAPREVGEKIQVDDIVSKLALMYEKLRNTMDYHEDHLLRRYAIERDIKRRVVLETLKPRMALSLIEGLIRSGYLPNDTVPESAVEKISAIISKYVYLLDLAHDRLKENRIGDIS